MIRKILFKRHDNPPLQTKRNCEIQRIETFSDGVFAFAVTLLIVSLEVPKNFEELLVTMRGFFAFGISFLLLVIIWNEQHRFFRNYGLDDKITVILNVALLFIVLFYVYPLKFLFTVLFADQIYGPGKSPFQIANSQGPALLEIYAIGYVSIYTLFLLMYLRALKKSNELDLSAHEKFDCRTSIYRQVVMICIGLSSLMLAATLPKKLAYAGLVYSLIAPALTVLYRSRSVKRRVIAGA